MNSLSPNADDYGHCRIFRRPDGALWELGRGAMGVTYKAEDQSLRCPVALKVISPQLTEDRRAREFFLAEARGAASLRHRNVAAVHHLGSRGDEFFYVMEYVEGETVETLLRRQGRLDPLVALDVAQQTACALAAASRRGIVHRDLKPANLMLTDEGDGALVVKVIDFGLCKSLPAKTAPAAPAKKRPLAAGFLGTPQYASPEQIRDDPDLDVRSDFYSLGATLWHMLAGRAPFTGTVEQVRQRHLETAPDVSALPDHLADAVRELLAALLSKDPAARPPNAADLIDRIEGAAYASREVDPRKTWTKLGCLPLLGSVLAHNFHLEAIVDETDPAGPLFRAEDVAGGRTVAVRLLDRSRSLDSLREVIARRAAAPHPNLLTSEAMSCRGQPFIVREWIEGFTLGEVCKERGCLTPPEVARLVAQAAAALDHVHAHNLGAPDLHLGAVQVRMLDGAGSLTGLPVTQWPPFELKLSVRERPDAEQTAGSPVTALAHFAGDLLGRDSADTLFEPEGASPKTAPVHLPNSGAAVVDLLCRALAVNSPFATGQEFAQAFAQAAGAIDSGDDL